MFIVGNSFFRETLSKLHIKPLELTVLLISHQKKLSMSPLDNFICCDLNIPPVFLCAMEMMYLSTLGEQVAILRP